MYIHEKRKIKDEKNVANPIFKKMYKNNWDRK